MMYKEILLEHYKNPRNFGIMKGADKKTNANNPLCGDQLQVFLKLKKGKIEDIKFKGEGCALSIAAMSMFSEFAKGKKVKVVTKMTPEKFLKTLKFEVLPARLKCALLGFESTKELLK